jgi:hypothetical protein
MASLLEVPVMLSTPVVSAKVGKNHKFMIFNPFLGLIDRLFLSLFVIYTKIDKN